MATAVANGISYMPRLLAEDAAAAFATQLQQIPPHVPASAFGPATAAFSESFPDPVPALLALLKERGIVAANAPVVRVAINQYPVGCGVVSHRDCCGERVAIVSLCSYCVLHVTSPNATETVAVPLHHQILLEPGSVVVLEGPAFSELVHAIDFVEEDVVTPDLANFAQLVLREGAVVHRSARISVAVWT
eukprot:TRINITY_DN22153_c0_g1_i1.p1 TRINITY_DN22153_c0_g1~~TRINITY_DN22153_c0_g1_i1.p1  ORF type:complete len:199 (+),score=30.61 TRINITY_DN22153_c0_g1_i1:30-599(+)